MKRLLVFIFLCIPIILSGYEKRGKCVFGDCDNGRGKFVYTDGNEYNGSWMNGKRHGYGTMVWLQTSLKQYIIDSQQGPYRYDGKVAPLDPILLPILTVITNVKESKKRKAREPIEADIRYIGNWSNDSMHGIGTLYLNDGSFMYGRWNNNKYMGK